MHAVIHKRIHIECLAEGSKKYDKRHLYLQYEGAIRPDSDAAEHMPKSDLVKRENAIKEKKTKLQSPLFFVSPVRLSIRNLAKHIDDATLKSLGKDVRTTSYHGVHT
jgi:nucleolar protein 4